MLSGWVFGVLLVVLGYFLGGFRCFLGFGHFLVFFYFLMVVCLLGFVLVMFLYGEHAQTGEKRMRKI